MNDWEYTELIKPKSHLASRYERLARCVYRSGCIRDRSSVFTRFTIERCLAFMEAHKQARAIIKAEFFSHDVELSSAESIVLTESKSECEKAVALVDSFNEADVELVLSHKFCNILLNSAVKRVEHLTEAMLLKETEAEEFLEEVQHQLDSVDKCRDKHGIVKKDAGDDSIDEEAGKDKNDDDDEEDDEEDEGEQELPEGMEAGGERAKGRSVSARYSKRMSIADMSGGF